MSSCGFGAPGNATAIDQPWGHDGTTPVAPGPNADNPPSLGPAGTVHCTLTDWGKFLAVHLHGARNESVSLVTQATLTALQTPPTGGDYASGWGVVQRDWAGGLALSHSGSNTLWYVTAWLAPAKNTTLAVVTNRGDDVAGVAVDSAFGPLIATYIK
jgi:CubicO group peptidase (beta-lactamase class C family)